MRLGGKYVFGVFDVLPKTSKTPKTNHAVDNSRSLPTPSASLGQQLSGNVGLCFQTLPTMPRNAVIVYGFQFPARIDCISNVIAHLHGASVNKAVITSRSKLMSHLVLALMPVVRQYCPLVLEGHGLARRGAQHPGDVFVVEVVKHYRPFAHILWKGHSEAAFIPACAPLQSSQPRDRICEPPASLVQNCIQFTHIGVQYPRSSLFCSNSGSETSGATSNQTLCTFPAHFLCFAYNQMDVEGKNFIIWTPSAWFKAVGCRDMSASKRASKESAALRPYALWR
ncbi:hypothetical protein C8J57DRAFT_1480668 [Mycena rebaudengoi]|nr:hypothetical protein C8J57DRAFT_1485899 [Mycena rebaudengoi]KAJ7232352.1 hypothetical protein C8J57DRAFT_1480668 [Mycena rebaudengoi]